MTDVLYTIYRSDLAAARAAARDSGREIRLAGGGRYGDPESQVAMQAADALWGVPVAVVEPDGTLVLRLPLRMVEDIVLLPGRHPA